MKRIFNKIVDFFKIEFFCTIPANPCAVRRKTILDLEQVDIPQIPFADHLQVGSIKYFSELIKKHVKVSHHKDIDNIHAPTYKGIKIIEKYYLPENIAMLVDSKGNCKQIFKLHD